MQIDSYQRKARKEELWNTLAHPLHTNEFRLCVFSFVSSLLQGLGRSRSQGGQWGALAWTFPQSSWLVQRNVSSLCSPPPLQTDSQIPNLVSSLWEWSNTNYFNRLIQEINGRKQAQDLIPVLHVGLPVKQSRLQGSSFWGEMCV